MTSTQEIFLQYFYNIFTKHFTIFLGYVEPGLPPVQPPPFTIDLNGTIYSFGEIMSDIGSGVIVIPIISILESIAIASAFAGGKTIDATQVSSPSFFSVFYVQWINKLYKFCGKMTLHSQ